MLLVAGCDVGVGGPHVLGPAARWLCGLPRGRFCLPFTVVVLSETSLPKKSDAMPCNVVQELPHIPANGLAFGELADSD